MPPIDTNLRGKIFRLPPDAAVLHHDSWWHWHIVVGVDQHRNEAIAIYGTGSDEDHQVAPPLCLDIQPEPDGPPGTGVSKWTHFVLPAIVRTSPTKLFDQKGELRAEWHKYFAARVREGIGYGSGPGFAQSIGTVSHRGKIARLKDEARDRFKTRYAMLLTPNSYSAANRYQCLVPVYDARRAKVTPEPSWIRLSAPWGPQITGKDASTAFYAAPELVTSVWSERHIECVIDRSFSKEQLAEVEQAVFEYLVLTTDPAIRPLVTASPRAKQKFAAMLQSLIRKHP